MAKSTETTKKSKRKRSNTINSKTATKFSTYEKAMEFLCSVTDYEKQVKLRYNVNTFSLDRMNKLLTYLGNPQEKVPSAHIAGTKGKGSTATMLARMLEYNDYKIGLYTSPHLVNIHERISINNQLITEEQMLDLINRVAAPVKKMANSDACTFFEIFTAMALLFFADQEVDLAVIETGLGGRLDSTNVIIPKVIGITNLSIDHQRQLGNTLEKIAGEKAGVFKKGIPIISVKQKTEALNVLKKQALEVDAPLSVTGDDIDFSYRFETSREYGPHNRICITTPTSKFEHLRVPLHGKHQAINCGLALSMLDKLKGLGYKIDNEKAEQGLNTVSIEGRMEMICQDPRIMIDAAHNAESIKALIQAIGQNIPYDSMVVIFGCNADKDVQGMLKMLQYGADKVIFTRSVSPRAMSPDELAAMYTEICGKMCQASSSLGEALALAKSAVGREDLISITGSFYLIGQAKKRFQAQKAS
jgi:dihydrofolate synthase/folylpolyglutamate synthase